jgi:AcrR family transcriptional regulator
MRMPTRMIQTRRTALAAMLSIIASPKAGGRLSAPGSEQPQTTQQPEYSQPGWIQRAAHERESEDEQSQSGDETEQTGQPDLDLPHRKGRLERELPGISAGRCPALDHDPERYPVDGLQRGSRGDDDRRSQLTKATPGRGWSGVHRTTIYRRWQTRENLVGEALTEQMASGIVVLDTGDVATDLRELARAFVEWMAGASGRAMLATILSQDAARVPDIAAIKRRLVDERFRRAEPVVIRGIERGELPAGTDPAEVVKTLIAPIYLRLLVTDEPIDETTADQAAQVALLAAPAGVLKHSSETARG